MNKRMYATSMIQTIITCLLLSAMMSAQAQVQQGTINFNDGWKFAKGLLPGAETPSYNDASWRTLSLPHDWAIEGPFSKEWASATAFLPGGIGWYRKTFTLPAFHKGQHCFIDFDGVYKNSEVWINGHYLGKRPSGFAAFEYDLTSYLLPGQRNTLAVKVDHSGFADSRWYTGSGIYRDVHLRITNPVHIGLWGVSFQTSAISDASAQANVTVNIVDKRRRTSKASTQTPIIVTAVLLDPNGQTAAKSQQTLTSDSIASLSLQVAKPHCWSTDRPDLYQLMITVSAGAAIVDTWKGAVGIRSVRFDPDNGFFLNGIATKIKGVCIHDDAGVLGVAATREVWVRRLRTLKASGCNALRMSHNPHADWLYDLCDQMGFLVMDEAFDEWEVGKNKWIEGWNKGTPGNDGTHVYFDEWGQRDLQDMVRRDKNHPSICLWSIGNEIDYPNDPYSDPVLDSGRNPQIYGKGYLPDHPQASRLGELSAKLSQWVKDLDTTRPVTAALAGVVMSNTTTYPSNLDAVGYNYQEYRYPADHHTYPSRVIYGSENSKTAAAWEAVDTNRFIAGQFLWTGIDYLGEAGQWPSRSNGAGLLNMAGFQKPECYYQQSLWSKAPMIYALVAPTAERGGGRRGGRRENAWNGHPGDSIRVLCFTNCETAELWVNGQRVDQQTRTNLHDPVVLFRTIYAPGVVTVKGRQQGKTVSYSLFTPGAPTTIKASLYKDPLIPAHPVLQQVEVVLVDSADHRVLSDDQEVTVQLKGATLAGIENGDLSDVGDYHAAVRRTLQGRLIVYLRPAKLTPWTLTLSAPGCKPVIIRQ